MCQQAVIADRGAESTEDGEKESPARDSPTGDREENQPGDGQHMNQDKVEENRALTWDGFPDWLVPRGSFLDGSLSQVLSILRMEARGRIELPNKGFADLCLTTWLPRRAHSSITEVVTDDAARDSARVHDMEVKGGEGPFFMPVNRAYMIR